MGGAGGGMRGEGGAGAGGGAGWGDALGAELAAAMAEAREAAAAAFRAGVGAGAPGRGGGGFAEFREHAEGFVRAVDWREPWLVGLLAAHAALFAAALRLRRSAGAQIGIFLGAGALVYGAEALNGLLAGRWEAFATQNYFDKAGLFTSVVLSGPLLVCCLLTQVNLLAIVSRDLVRLKRMELRHRARQAEEGAGPGSGSGAGMGGRAPAAAKTKTKKKKA